ncbi:Phospholipid-transporting ATPase FetA [Sciurus carolinensis]|uniref:Phospholipid-transporting ATPase n=1 Tax=Sciurus carolinensis TaxID=30640 RepID=A0AA41MXJ0_SCICA|nr:Phospholipid-transporting ATPase FetA [Sciurus carolinensis]
MEVTGIDGLAGTLIPQISSLAWYTTVIPLVVVLSITGVKDAIDDWADLLLLSSSEPYSLAYIETADLDGETNLKVKQAISVTSDMGDNLDLLSTFDGEVRCDPPNNKLDKFTGILTYKRKSYSLDHDKLLLRGCIIRNTDWCYGLVIYTGPDTKLMQNSGKSIFKRTHMDHLMNLFVIWIFLFLGAMCFMLAIGHGIWENKKGYHFQIFLPQESYVSSSVISAIFIFWSYFIILNTMVPISLYVSVEIIRLGNSFYINWDRKMFYEPKNTPAQARTTTLNEELGQVKYVFSDKTGTLTQNIMIFKKCSINGKAYGSSCDKEGLREPGFEKEEGDFYNKLTSPKCLFHDQTLMEAVKKGDHWVHMFFLSLSLCHTVMSQEKVEGELVYQAQSPDEGALVTAARNLGFVFRSRTSETITVVEMGKTRVYQLLAILDFSSVRKRMSVIVRTPENRVMLFCKGADTIISELLHRSCVALNNVTMEHLDDFASDGLRTLMVAYRELDDKFFNTWSKKHNEACLSAKDREIKLSVVYAEIEKDLMLLGATGIEDKLQDGVPETIITLNKAKIKIWVLTGDKQETAINIAYSCNVFEDEMDGVFMIEGKDSETILQELRTARGKMKPESLLESDPVNIYLKKKPKRTFTMPEEVPRGDYGLVINGYSLAFALEGNLELELLRTASLCKGVICCRMTPFQKAQVVELVKRYKKVVTLAIGDGANDVSMIKGISFWGFIAAAHIGVGISGQEGMQAMLNSDFAFSQFCYLQRLLLVHGRWSYNRMCKFLSYFFYKNFVFTLVHFWYAFFNGFSAQDVNETWSLHFPELYIPGQHNLYFNKKEFVKCLIHGIYSSFVLFFVPMGTIYNSERSDGKDISDIQTFCLIVQTSLIWMVTVQVFDRINHCKTRPPQVRVRTKLKHPSLRRSAYAFSHKQGFGALITSGKTTKIKPNKRNSFPVKK